MYRRTIWLLIVLTGIGCFVLNWTISNNAAFTLSATDLAEWASLHPEVRAGSPSLLVSFLLRLPAALAICMLVMQLRRHGVPGIVLVSVGVIGATGLLPPWEFFTQYTNDPNYRQQAALAILTLALCTAISRLRQEKLVIIETSLALATGISTFAGLGLVQGLIRSFGIEAGYGLGGAITLVASLILGVVLLSERLQPTRK